MDIGEMNRTERDEIVEYVTAENIATAEGAENYKRNFKGQVLMLLNLQAEGRDETAEVLTALIGIGVYFIKATTSKGKDTLRMLPIVGKGHFQSVETWQQWRGAMLKDTVIKRDLAYIVDKAVKGQCHYEDCALRKVSSDKKYKPKCAFKADCLFVQPECEYAEQMFEQHYNRLGNQVIRKFMQK